MGTSLSSNDTTSAFYMPETVLMQQAGVAVFRFLAKTATTTPLNGYQPSNGAFQWYQASVVPGEGSWWFPVAAVNMVPLSWNNPQNGGLADLHSSGSGIWTSEGPNRMVRPSQLFWWVPQAVFSQGDPLTPGSNNHQPTGSFPRQSPYPKPPPPTVVQTNGQILITIPPESGSTVVAIRAPQ